MDEYDGIDDDDFIGLSNDDDDEYDDLDDCVGYECDSLGDYSLEGMCHQGKAITFYKIIKPSGEIVYLSYFILDKKYRSTSKKTIKETRSSVNWYARKPSYYPVRMRESTYKIHKDRKYKQWEVDENGNIIEQVLPEKAIITEIKELPKFAMPKYPAVTVPALPAPPEAVSTIEAHFKSLNTWYKDVTGKHFTFSYNPGDGARTFSAYGLGPFFITGANKIQKWFKPESCSSTNIPCQIRNVVRTIRGVRYTRAFLAYASSLISTYIADGMDLNMKAGTKLLKNLAALPKDTQVWFTKLQKDYSKALESYIKSIQCEMVSSVDRLRGNINRTFKNAERQFKTLLAKADKDIQKQLKDVQAQIKKARTDFDKQVKAVKAQVTTAMTDFKKNLRVVNTEIEKAKKELVKIMKDVKDIRNWTQSADERIKKLEAKVSVPSAPPNIYEQYLPQFVKDTKIF